MNKPLFTITCVALFMFAILKIANAQTSIPVYPNEKQEASVKKIEKALSQTCDIDLKNVPLSDLPKLLTNLLKVEVELDYYAFTDDSITPEDELIIRKVKGISYRSALKLILDELGAAFVMKNEVLLITTKETIYDPSMFIVKIYPVEDLLGMDNMSAKKLTEQSVDFDSLIDLIVTTVEPNTWQVGGDGEGTISSFDNSKMGVLVISQTEEVHKSIELLIVKLRKHHQSRIKTKQSSTK